MWSVYQRKFRLRNFRYRNTRTPARFAPKARRKPPGHTYMYICTHMRTQHNADARFLWLKAKTLLYQQGPTGKKTVVCQADQSLSHDVFFEWHPCIWTFGMGGTFCMFLCGNVKFLAHFPRGALGKCWRNHETISPVLGGAQKEKKSQRAFQNSSNRGCPSQKKQKNQILVALEGIWPYYVKSWIDKGNFAAPPDVRDRQCSFFQVQPQQKKNSVLSADFFVHSSRPWNIFGSKNRHQFSWNASPHLMMESLISRQWMRFGGSFSRLIDIFLIGEIFNTIVFAVFVVSLSFRMLFEIPQILVLVNTPGPSSIFCVSLWKKKLC